MPTTKSDAFTGKFPVRNIPLGSHPTEVPFPFSMPAAAPAANDIIAIGKVPAGAEIVGYELLLEDCDSGAGLVLTLGSLNAGLTDIATAYAAGLTVGQTGGTVVQPAAAAPAHWSESNAAERSVGLKVTTIAAGYLAGKKGLLTLKLRG